MIGHRLTGGTDFDAAFCVCIVELYDVGRPRLIALNYDWGCGYA
jgi:hypothetical protein